MKKSLIALFAVFVAAVACNKTGELEERVTNLENRVTTLEEQVKNLNEKTIPGLQATVAAIQASVTVSSVTTTADGYSIVFSNGTTATIANGVNGTDGTDGTDGAKGDKGDTPVISAKEVDGVFYWTADGEFLTDASGNKIPVHATLPQFRINQGKWEVSYDAGTTWTVVETMGSGETSTSLVIEDGVDTVTFWIGETPYVIQKEVAFYLVFDQREGLGAAKGGSANVPYTISGVKDEDVTEVDVLNVIGAGWSASVAATDNKSGVVTVSNTDGGSAKVFVYATNGKGKTDIKSLTFEEGAIDVVVKDAESVPAEGAQVGVFVTTNVDYEVEIAEDAQSWISVAPETKAMHTDSLYLVVAANTATAARSGEVKVVDPVTKAALYEFTVYQQGAEPTKYEAYIGKWVVGGATFEISQKLADSTYNVEGLYQLTNATYGGMVAEAVYDKTTGNFVLSEQVIGTWTSSSGAASTYLCGIFATSSGKTYPHWTGNSSNASAPSQLIVANLDADGNLLLAPGKDKNGSDFLGYLVRWSYDEKQTTGNYLFNYPKASNLPATATKAKEASSAYSSWLGTWTITTNDPDNTKPTQVTVEFTDIRGCADSLIIVNGLGTNGYPLYFDAASGKLQALFTTFAVGCSSTYDYYSGGITTDGYVCTGNSETGLIAEFELTADGVKITAPEYYISDERPAVAAARFGILGYKLSTSGWVTFSDVTYLYPPTTAVKAASGSSVKAASLEIFEAECAEAVCEMAE